jgi:hypothetical protein
MMKPLLAGFLVWITVVPAAAQGTPGTLLCAFTGAMDVHATREPSSPVVARISCGTKVLLIDSSFGAPHLRLEDGKDGYLTGVNFGQWSFQQDGAPIAAATPAPNTTPVTAPVPAPLPVATSPQIREPQGGDEFRRFDVGWTVFSYNRQEEANLFGGDVNFVTHLNDTVAIVADLAVHETLDEPTLQLMAYRFGPRFYTPKIGRSVSPFLEVLAGGIRLEVSQNFTFQGVKSTVKSHENAFAASAGGGMDVRIKPWLSWRMFKLDFSYFHMDGANSRGGRVGTGLVFRFGR